MEKGQIQCKALPEIPNLEIFSGYATVLRYKIQV